MPNALPIRLRIGAAALVAALATSLAPGAARAACTPVNAPPQSVGCAPPLVTAQPTDLLLGWRVSLFPASSGSLSVAQVLGALTSAEVIAALGFTPLSAALTSFDTRTGPSITLTSGDVTTALGFTPLSAALTSFDGRTGPSITLTSGDVTTALTFTPENAANKGTASGYAPLDANSRVPLANLPAAFDARGITLSWVGVPGASQIAQTVLNVPCTIAANFAGSQSWLGTTSAGTPAFALSYIHGGSSNAIGNLTLTSGSHAATYPTTTAIPLAVGDVFVGISPGTPDATAADLALTINCTLPTP